MEQFERDVAGCSHRFRRRGFNKEHWMTANDFDALIETALGESQGSRLLLVLLRVETKAERSSSGSLTPLLANDLEVAPDISLQQVIAQADLVGLPWDMIMASVLSDPTGKAPSSAAAEPYLKKMADDVMRGGDLSRYAFFDREGSRLAIAREH